MSIVKEPKGVDFYVKSEPWTDEELADFRKLMKKEKTKLSKEKYLKPEKARKKRTVNSH